MQGNEISTFRQLLGDFYLLLFIYFRKYVYRIKGTKIFPFLKFQFINPYDVQSIISRLVKMYTKFYFGSNSFSDSNVVVHKILS